MNKIGFTIGKFAPFHKGHEYLIKTALKEMDKVYVIIYETNVIDIPIEQRAKWIQKLYPEVNILYAINPPMQYGLDKESVRIQVEYIKKIIKDIPVTHFFSSEEYGKYVAEYLNIEDRRVDNNRININISATDIRNNIEIYIKYLSDTVYQDIRQKNAK